MTFNKALIPIYMNNDMLNNLFSVVVQEYIETESVSKKDTVSVHIKTPISEFSYDLFGKYVQGDLDIQIQNEFIKQKTEESISISIVILKKLKDILTAHKLLKYINTTDIYDSLDVNDYVEFNCMLNKNPILANIESTIGMLEADDYIGTSKLLDADYKDNGKYNPKQMLDYLRNSLDKYKNDHCLRYVGSNIDNLDRQCIIPLRSTCFLDNEDYLLNGNIRILGKVTKKFKNEENRNTQYNPYLNNCILDYIDCSEVNNLTFPYLLQTPNIASTEYKKDNNYPFYDILPIVIYI